MKHTYTAPLPYRSSLISHAIGINQLYWNYFASFLVAGFRKRFAMFNATFINFFFSKSFHLIRKTFSKFYPRALLFGFFEDYEKKLLDIKRNSDEFIIFYKLFLKTYNVIYRGFFWRGGGLTNFRKFKSVSQHFFTLPRKQNKYRYYPTIVFSTYYSYSTYSIGFESISAKVPLITPVNPGVDPKFFPYPIPINSYSQNIYFFHNFYFSTFFKSFSFRFLRFSFRKLKKLKNSIFSRRRNKERRRKERRSVFLKRLLVRSFSI